MSPTELRELADRMVGGPWNSDVDAAVTYLRACADALDAGPVAWHYDGLAHIPVYPIAMPAQATEERKAWGPYLSDKADGVCGHYAICRWNPAGYRETWNLRSHRWASASDEVLTIETATDLLKRLVIPTAPQPALKLPEPMTDAEMMRALGNLTGLDMYDAWRRAEAATLRRVREANE